MIRRYMVCFMIWVSFVLLLGSRYALRNALVVRFTYYVIGSRNQTICGENRTINKLADLPTNIPEWEWVTKKRIFTLEYCYRAGYMVIQLPVGILCDLYGARHFLAMGLLGSGVINLLIPIVLHKTQWIHITFLSIINGMFHGGCVPAAFSLMAHWVPNEELTFLTSMSYFGVTAGNTLSQVVSAYFMTYLGHWTVPFFFWFGLIAVWYIVFINMVFSGPVTDPYLKGKEKQHLIEQIGTLSPCRIPWKGIFIDCALWAIISAQAGHMILQAALDIGFPYFSYDLFGLHLSLEPHYMLIQILLRGIAIVPCSILGDYLIKRNLVPTIYLRSIYVGLGNIVGSSFYLLATFMNCQKNPTILSATFGTMFVALFYSGISANIIDRTRHYAGFFTAIEDCLTAMSTPISTQLVLKIKQNNTISDWKKVFWFTLAATIFTTVVYFMWSKGERAKWDVVALIVT